MNNAASVSKTISPEGIDVPAITSNRTADITLDSAAIGQKLSVEQVQAPHAAPEWARWLEEIGFIAGEQVMLMARALPGGDPLVVRVGQSTFALRRAEASCVQVVPAAFAGHQRKLV